MLASVPEDDLPALQELKKKTQNHMTWNVHTVGSEPIEGFVDDIGYLIDPNQHTAVVRGHIPNPDGVLRAGQFVTATVELPPPEDVVEVPISALVEDGKDSVVFVQSDPPAPVFTMRRVEVTNRFDRTAFVRSRRFVGAERSAGLEAGAAQMPIEPLRKGERCLPRGVESKRRRKTSSRKTSSPTM